MKIRLPEELKQSVEAAAQANGRSMNAEIVTRLEGSFTGDLAQRVQWVNDGLNERLESIQSELDQQRALAQQFRSIADDSDSFRTLLASILLSVLEKLPEDRLNEGIEGRIFRSVGEWLSDRDVRGAVFSILKLIERAPPDLVEHLQNFSSHLEDLGLVNKPVVIQRPNDFPRKSGSVNKVIIVGNLGQDPELRKFSGRELEGEILPKPPANKGPTRSPNMRKPAIKK